MTAPGTPGGLLPPLFTCKASARAGGMTARQGDRIIDMHCHVLTVAVEQLVGGMPQKASEQQAMNRAMGDASVAASGAMLKELGPRMVRVEQRLADMDAMGVDVQVLSPAPNQYCYWAEDDLAERIVSLQNENVASVCEKHPTRFAGLGTLALQNPSLAIKQLDHAVGTLGLRGVEISTHVNGVALSDARFAPLWQRIEELGAVVLLHPLGSEQGERLNTHYLWNVIGQPFETTVALSQLAFHGVFERHPRLKLCACHGGGFLGAYWGRSDHAWRVRPEARATPHPPSHYLKRVFHDTIVYDPAELRALIDHVGAEQVVVGTDYPFDMGHYDLIGLLDAVTLDDAQRAAILHGNAERLMAGPDGQPFTPGLQPRPIPPLPAQP